MEIGHGPVAEEMDLPHLVLRQEEEPGGQLRLPAAQFMEDGGAVGARRLVVRVVSVIGPAKP